MLVSGAFNSAAVNPLCGIFEKLGFLITTSIYLFAQLMVLAPERSIKGTVRFAVASAAAAYILQYIFIRLLYVMLPEGLLR